MPPIKIGINLWSQASSWADFLAAAKRVDELGYDSLWTWDHLHAILGIGGAWFEYEHTAHGIDFGTGFGQRLTWLDESVAAMRTLLDGGTVTSDGKGRYGFQDLHHVPDPVQRHVPIMIGGTGRTKTLRTIARYGDQWNAAGTPELLGELGPILDGYLEEEGRPLDAIERTSNLWMIIRDTEREARRVWDETMATNVKDVDEGMIAEHRPILGPVEKVAARIREYVDAGFPAHIVELPAPYDPETLERLIGEVQPLVERG